MTDKENKISNPKEVQQGQSFIPKSICPCTCSVPYAITSMYTKDLSFELKNYEETVYYLSQNIQPSTNIQVFYKQVKEGEAKFEVVINLTAELKNDKENKSLYIFQIEHAAHIIINAEQIREEQLAYILNVEVPAQMFPFTRCAVINKMMLCGLQINLPILTIKSFMELYQRQLEELAKQRANSKEVN